MTNKLLTKNDFHFLNNKYEDDIYQMVYQSTDNRVLKSYTRDIYDGDNFADFCEEFFELLEEEEYWD